MRAIRQYEFGPAENLLYQEVDDLLPGAGQVRVAVRAAGVHLIDTVIRSGEQRGPIPRPELPMTPGREVAGVVDLVGEGVDSSWLGRRVVVHLGMASGGYAEQAVADASSLHALADQVGFEAAVAMMGTGRMTMGMLAVADLTADDVVLVTSAAGGIGTLLVQEARHLGATVVGLAGGPAKVGAVRALGADVAVDYTAEGWPEVVRGELGDRKVTVAFDGVGGRNGRAVFELLGPGGRLIVHGWSAGTPVTFTSQEVLDRGLTVVTAVGPRILGLPGGLRRLEERAQAALAAGRLIPTTHAFPLKEAAAAHTALAERRTTGKVVLIP
jgi:NADPH2:quinone reductase